MTDCKSGARLSARGLSKRLSESFQLAVDSLDVAAGETLALVGPTGSGKSTLLRLLAGLVSADQGAVALDGIPFGAAGDDALRRRIAWVPQTPLLLRGSVRYNVEYGRRIRGLACDGVVDELLKSLELDKLAEQSARTLSGGQTQLTALARALATEPSVLLLDEPTANLDPARVALVERSIGASTEKLAPAVVWATHNLFQARRTAKKACLLLDGAVVETSPVETFFALSSDRRTADFLAGKMIY